METLPLNATDDEIFRFARRWTEFLIQEDYAAAWAMLCYVPRTGKYIGQGESWSPDAEDMRAWIVNWGTNKPAPGEPTYKVTSPEEADEKLSGYWAGNGPDKLNRCESEEDPGYLYPGYRGRLDWWLPLSGEWSDLQASFDLLERDGRLAFVLAALRVP